MRLHLPALLATLGLAACGGGGGSASGPASATLDSGNYVAAAREALAASTFLSSSTSLLVGAEVADSRLLIETALTQARGVGRRLPPALATGVIVSSIEACSGGGSVTVVVDDRNSNNNLDTGDSIRLTMANCIESGVQMGGVLTLAYDSVTGDLSTDVFSTRVTMGMENFAIRTAAFDGSATGRLTLAETSRALNDTTLEITAQTLASASITGGVTVNRTQTDYTLRRVTTPSAGGVATSLTSGGTLASSAVGNGSMVLATETPFTRPAGSTYPTAGRMTVSGGAGSKLRITAQDGTNALIELDANGDGSFEASSVRAWNTLI